jgi:hypothetical protein
MSAGILAVLVCGLVACSQPPPPEQQRALPEPDSVSAKLYVANCSECHAAPHPDAHPANEWQNIIYRMQNYRVTKGHGAIPEPEVRRILSYLKQHARQP